MTARNTFSFLALAAGLAGGPIASGLGRSGPCRACVALERATGGRIVMCVRHRKAVTSGDAARDGREEG